MHCRKLFMSALSAVMVLAVVLSGCSGDDGAEGPVGPEGPQGPPGPTILKPFIVAEIQAASGSDTTADARIAITYLSGVPTVNINQTNIPFQYWYHYACARMWDYYLPDKDGDSILMTAEFPKSDGTAGAAYARVVIPEQFEIISPDTSINILTGIGDSLRVHWSQSTEADAYGVSFDLSYYYELESGDTGYFHIDLDTFITDTTIFFPDSLLYPYAADIVNIWSFYETFRITAYDGPVLPGAQANVTGDAIGVLYSEKYGGQLNFILAGPMATDAVPKQQPDRPDISQVIFERLSQRFNSEAP